MDKDKRIDDHYLTEVLKLSPGFIIHHARAMGNVTRPRSYFLDTVLAYLRHLEAESQGKQRNKTLNAIALKREVIHDLEVARARMEMKRRRTASNKCGSKE